VHRHAAIAVDDAILREDLEAFALPGPWDPERLDHLRRVPSRLEAALDHAARHDVDAGVRHHVHHHGDLLDTGLGEDQLCQLANLLHRRVAADLAVVGGLSAVHAHGIEECERSAARADHEAEVAVELHHVAGDAAVVGLVHLAPGDLE